jgi:NADH-quinone oxidoreductase subunit M
MYIDFFFNPILIWNGYFSNTIIDFFFTNAISSTRINNPLTFDYFIAFDGLNIWLIWLTSLLVFLCTIYLLDTVKLHTFLAQVGWIYLLAFASFQFFCVPSYLWMYIYFELSLLPIFILIIFWGSNNRKIHAAYQMVIFTFIGSMFLLAAIFLLFTKIKSFNSFDIFFVTQSPELNIIFSTFEKKLIWLCLFIGFAVKTPLYPFHIWLPEAHSEAPTTGSVMLAGVLLKMGTYGFLRFVIPLFPSLLETFKTLVFSMCIFGIIFSSLAALAQIDIKKIIAYSSIGHMGLVVIGIYTLNMNGLLGASYMMLSHGLISSALFFSIGILYKIYGTRSIVYYSSIAHFMPRFAMCFFVFSLANMSFPGTAGFPGEILIFAGIMDENFFLSVLVSIGSIFSGIYSIWLLT